MDVSVQSEGILFVWDSNKAASNLQKHGVAFEDCIQLFHDLLTDYRDAGIDEESRTAAIGFSHLHGILLVIYLEQDSHSIRIISARPAEPRERRAYENK